MKVTKVEIWAVEVKQETPYEVAYSRYASSNLVFLRLSTDVPGIVGHGCAGCDQEVTGETDETVATALKNVAEPMLHGANPLLLHGILHDLKTALGRQPSALATVDMALHDITAQALALPLWKYLGGCRDRIETSITIGILPEPETIRAAQQWIARGFRCLKLKGGLAVETDIERVVRVRETAGPDIELRFDANQGYSLADALRFAKETQRARVAFMEQPTPAQQPELLGQFRAANLVPVMADECLLDADDAWILAKHGWADLWNVKLMKCGGIAEAVRIETMACAANVPIMVGCMDESALGIAAGLHYACGLPATTFADLDGHIGLLGDPAAGQLRLVNGVLFPPDKPGLGIDLVLP